MKSLLTASNGINNKKNATKKICGIYLYDPKRNPRVLELPPEYIEEDIRRFTNDLYRHRPRSVRCDGDHQRR